MKLYRLAQFVALGVLVNRLRYGADIQKARGGNVGSHRVSVIIPARNEATNIVRCLESLGAVDEIIVVDDCSSDNTAELARKHGARVVDGKELPAGWIGKPWALQQGLEVASGDIVVCLDADTISSEGLVAALVNELEDVDFVSFATRFRCDSVLEKALHTSMLAGLVYRFGPPGTPLPAHRRIANGQCMAFRRDWFISQGSFNLSRSNMTDDVALVRKLAADGARIKFIDGSEFIETDMHDSTSDVWKEWGRSLPMPDATQPFSRWADLGFLWVSQGLPWVRLVTGRANLLDVVFLGIRNALNFGFSSAYSGDKRGVFLSGLLDPAALVRLTQATYSPVRSW